MSTRLPGCERARAQQKHLRTRGAVSRYRGIVFEVLNWDEREARHALQPWHRIFRKLTKSKDILPKAGANYCLLLLSGSLSSSGRSGMPGIEVHHVENGCRARRKNN